MTIRTIKLPFGLRIRFGKLPVGELASRDFELRLAAAMPVLEELQTHLKQAIDDAIAVVLTYRNDGFGGIRTPEEVEEASNGELSRCMERFDKLLLEANRAHELVCPNIGELIATLRSMNGADIVVEEDHDEHHHDQHGEYLN